MPENKALIEITIANQALLRRLQEKQSNYDVFKWAEDRAKNEKLVKNIGFYSSLQAESIATRSRTNLPMLKNVRQSSTRMGKYRIKKDYDTELKYTDLLKHHKKRAKTTRR